MVKRHHSSPFIIYGLLELVAWKGKQLGPSWSQTTHPLAIAGIYVVWNWVVKRRWVCQQARERLFSVTWSQTLPGSGGNVNAIAVIF